MFNKYGLSFITSSSPGDAIYAQKVINAANALRFGSSLPPAIAVEASFLVNSLFQSPDFYNVFSARTPFSSPWPIHRDNQQLTGFASALHNNKNGIYSISHVYTVPCEHYSGTGLLENLQFDARGHKARVMRLWAENDIASEKYQEKGFRPYQRDKHGKIDYRHLELPATSFDKALKNWRSVLKKPYEGSKTPSLVIPCDFSI